MQRQGSQPNIYQLPRKLSIETAEIYSYSYHVIPLNKTVSYKCQLASSNFIP